MHTVHVVLAAADLVVLLISALFTAAGRNRRWAWALFLTAAAWLPLNNTVLEGPALIGIGDQHGLTLSDFLGIGGVVLAGLRLWPRAGRHGGRWLLAAGTPVVAVLIAAFLLASFVTDVRVDDTRERGGARLHLHRHHHPHALVDL